LPDPTTEQVRLFLKHGDKTGARTASVLGSPAVKRVSIALLSVIGLITLAIVAPDLLARLMPIIARL